MSAPQPSSSALSPLKLLSLDGGGIRGLSSLIILKYLMKRVNPTNPPKPCDYFDLIGGTSTGGLIAVMLGRLQMDIDTCITKYCELSSIVFQPKRSRMNIVGRVGGFIKAEGSYSSGDLETQVKKIVHEVENDDQAQLLQSGATCKVFVCAFTDALNTPVRLRSYVTEDSVDTLSGSSCAIWQAARATSAAATFFDPIQIGKQKYRDGGTGYNNPVELVLEEASSIWPNSKSRIQCLVSLGTGVPELKDFGSNMIEIAKTLQDIATETETTEQRFFGNHQMLGVGGRYFRFNVDRGLGDVGLDEHGKMDKIESATERYLADRRIKERVEAFIAARAPLTSPCNAATKESYLAFLPHIDPLEYHNRARRYRTTKSTGEWFLHGELENWRLQPRFFLWLCAEAGSGKTVLTSAIIDEIEQRRLGTLAYFYFSFQERQPQDVHHFKHSILTQLVRRLTWPDPQLHGQFHVPRAFRDLYDKNTPSRNPKMEDLDETLNKVLEESTETYIVVDALDECPSPSDRTDIISFLASLSCSPRSNTHVLVTSRRQRDIEAAINALPNDTTAIVPFEAAKVDKDIKSHITACMTREPYRSWPDDLQHKVVNKLASGSGGNFRWVDLQLEELREKSREKDIDRTLSQLPRDLGAVYERILQRIDEQGYTNEAMTILKWVAYSPGPLYLSHAMEIVTLEKAKRPSLSDLGPDYYAVSCVPPQTPPSWTQWLLSKVMGPGTEEQRSQNESPPNLDDVYYVSFAPSNRFPDASYIRWILSGLVSITDSDDDAPRGRQDSVISFAHFSVKEYLESPNAAPSSFRLDSTSGKWFVFNSGLGYVHHYDKLHPWTGGSSMDIYPFIYVDKRELAYYISEDWPFYASRLCQGEGSNEAKKIIAAMLKQWLRITDYFESLSARLIIQTAGRMGDLRILQDLVAFGVDIDLPDQNGDTLLHWAVSMAQTDVIKYLARERASVSAENMRGIPPCHLRDGFALLREAGYRI